MSQTEYDVLIVGTGLRFCNQLFAIERELKDATPEDRYNARMERNMPILDGYLAWLHQLRSRTLPKSLLGVAIAYSMNQWDNLTTFLRDGRLEIDPISDRSEWIRPRLRWKAGFIVGAGRCIVFDHLGLNIRTLGKPEGEGRIHATFSLFSSS